MTRVNHVRPAPIEIALIRTDLTLFPEAIGANSFCLQFSCWTFTWEAIHSYSKSYASKIFKAVSQIMAKMNEDAKRCQV